MVALQLLGASVLIVGYLLKTGKISAFSVAYWLYVHTPLGMWLHNRELSKSRKAGPHSRITAAALQTRAYAVELVPMLEDNYCYLIIDSTTSEVAAVDPADAEAVLARVEELRGNYGSGLRLTTILTTHCHHDHAGGNQEVGNTLAPCA